MFGIAGRFHLGTKRYIQRDADPLPVPASLLIIVITLVLAFSEDLRETVFRAYKISLGLLKDFVFRPILAPVRSSSAGKVPANGVPEKSRLRRRFDEYLGYRQNNLQQDEDIWQRWQDDRDFQGKEGGMSEGV